LPSREISPKKSFSNQTRSKMIKNMKLSEKHFEKILMKFLNGCENNERL